MLGADIHCHLVPGVDDGSRDEDMSRELLHQAVEEGIILMITTPHNYPGRSEEKIPQLKERFGLLKTLAEEEAPGLSLYLGNEVFYRDSIVEDLQEERALTLAGTDYVLVEFHPGERGEKVFFGIRRLVEGGYRPVIAHVERIACFYKEERALQELRETGAFLQVNTHTLTGGLFDRRSAWWVRMCAAGHIHFLGSDAHHPADRPVSMQAALHRLQKAMDPEKFARLSEGNAQTLLKNHWIP